MNRKLLDQSHLESLVITRQGNARDSQGRIYGFTGRDAKLKAEKIYTGRAFPRFSLDASPLGNPYRVKAHTEAEHQKAVDAYRVWFMAQMSNPNSIVFQEIDWIADKLLQRQKIVLTCFCPEHLPCHARDVLEPAIVKQTIDRQTQLNEVNHLDAGSVPQPELKVVKLTRQAKSVIKDASMQSNEAEHTVKQIVVNDRVSLWTGLGAKSKIQEMLKAQICSTELDWGHNEQIEL